VAWTVRRADPVARRRTYTSVDGDRRRATGEAPRDGAVTDNERQAMMDPASRSDRVSHWLLHNGQLDSTTSMS